MGGGDHGAAAVFSREYLFQHVGVRDQTCWDWRSFDHLRDFYTARDHGAAILNVPADGVDAFFARGGKLRLSHGWGDGLIPAWNSEWLRRGLYHDLPRQQAEQQLRLFMAPEIDHFLRGIRPSQFNTPGVIGEWASIGRAPNRIIATGPTAFPAMRGAPAAPSRANVTPLCPYPLVASERGRTTPPRRRTSAAHGKPAKHRVDFTSNAVQMGPVNGQPVIDPSGPSVPPSSGSEGAASSDHAALRAACEPGVGLCTIVGIDGSFSRRLGAQLAVRLDGSIAGSLADGCLERQLVNEVRQAALNGRPVVKRFGSGSELIDFRLPCGSGLDILIDPTPDRKACRASVARLDAREAASLSLATSAGLLGERRYIPALRLLIFGEGPELAALRGIATVTGVAVEALGTEGPQALSLGRAPEGVAADPWTAIVLLFHDHEWEQPILRWALATPAFFIGAQGGAKTRDLRLQALSAAGIERVECARVRSPVGVIAHSREPGVLALSVLAEVVGEYEALHPHG